MTRLKPFLCPAATAGRDRIGGAWELPPGHDNVVRTGRTRRAPHRSRNGRLAESVEYRCECGHRGWTTSPAILAYPTQAEVDAAEQAVVAAGQAAILASVDNGSDCPSGKKQFVSREAARSESPERGFRQFHCDLCGCYHNGHVRRADKKREVLGR